MKFNYYQPTEIIFGENSIEQLEDCIKRYGTKAMIVTTPIPQGLQIIFDTTIKNLQQKGIEIIIFDEVIPNPTKELMDKGAHIAREKKVDVIVGFGGGSSMDSAKAIAVGAVHEGSVWDYLFFKTAPSDKTLPIIAIPTTSGTGSQVTQVAVISENDTETKSAIYNNNIFPKIALIDPTLMIGLPTHITAYTGFDAFTHAFEAYIHNNTNPYVEMLALDSIARIVKNLPLVLKDGSNIKARTQMAWADTLSGLCIASAGVTLPHGIGMMIGGHYHKISHGESLACLYPEFIKFTYSHAQEKFSIVAKLFNPELAIKYPNIVPKEVVYDTICDFLKANNLFISMKTLGITEEGIKKIADRSQDLPDYKSNPRIATLEEIYELLSESYRRI